MFYKDITIIIVTYKSTNKVLKFIKRIPKKFRIILIDNSKDISLKKKLKKNRNIKIYFNKNNGFGRSMNLAVKKIKTNYFFQISPDLEFNFKQLKTFYEVAKKLKDKFSALGPRFVNVNKKSHKQSDRKKTVANINAVHGSAMFINKAKFNLIGGIDEKIFLYFEENDYCRRGKEMNLNAFQLNKIIIKKKGQTVEFDRKKEQLDLQNLLSWHFIWSKFYFSQKKNGRFISIIIFLPILLRTILKIFYFKIIKEKKKITKYKYRYKGLIASMKGKKSYLRL